MKNVFLILGWLVVVALGVTIYGLYGDLAQANAKIAELQARVDELQGYAETEHIGGEMPYVWPFSRKDYLLPTSPFGERLSPFRRGGISEHLGVDLLGVWHARIVSISNGTVLQHWVPPDGVRWHGHPIYGGMLLIQHDDGSTALYAHLSQTFVHEGNRVQAGQLIARQGATGRANGEHLHLELTINGEKVNPLLYLQTP
jgi:murein DD-endopeptidase MepM/ murein hydrolase activator NlpD